MATRQPKTMPAGHTAGIFADVTLDGPEIGTLVAVVDRARNLPNRRTMGKQDPYCAMRLGKEARKTETDKRGGQTPKWDQELRFTIHDSPDYLKLKCSVFNDDKKTDLIGETWINLADIVHPGGGQNDLWHQLNYKGKYAGEIRLELTYYDLRPKSDPVVEKKTKRDKKVNVVSELGDISMPSSRHIGPREIRKRPLPQSPGVTPPAAEETAPLMQEEAQYQMSTQDYQQDQPQQYQQRASHAPMVPPKEPFYPETPDDFADYVRSTPYFMIDQKQYYEDPDVYDSPNDYEQSAAHLTHAAYTSSPQTFEHEPYDIQTYRNTYESTPPHSQQQSPYGTADQSLVLSDVPSPLSIREKQQPVHHRTHSSQSRPLYLMNERTYNSSPTSPATSPVKFGSYRDSPLRQSTNLTDIQPAYQNTNSAQESFEESPPPPPVHHSQSRGPANQLQSLNYSNRPLSSHDPSYRASIDYRSPLQQIEQDYSAHLPAESLEHQSPTLPRLESFTPPRKLSYPSPDQVNNEQAYMTPSRRKSHNPYVATEAEEMDQAVVLADIPTTEDLSNRKFLDQERGRYPIRADLPPSPPTRSATFEDERYTYRSQPQIVKPRAVSPVTPHSIPRKSVSPHPNSQERQMGSVVPFSPDSYDVFQPDSGASSPYTGPEVPSHSIKESARQREVDKLRDQGPIIGNDGRVIDPSDHLPSDTWAPEPDRKPRKPEHVIHVRTRGEVRDRARGSPNALGPRSAPTTPQKAGSVIPAGTSTLGSGINRERVDRQTPPRPLPAQPFPQPNHSQPLSPQQPPSARSNMPTKRHTMQYPISNPSPLYRPALEEYQVPEVQSYSPRTSTYKPSWQTTPTKMPATTSYSPSYGQENSYLPGNSLATEMSMIDIGPPRGNRTVIRSNRPYGAY